MQSNKSWARVALWGVLGFPVLIGQADVAMAQQRLVTSGSSSSLSRLRHYRAAAGAAAAAGDDARAGLFDHVAEPWWWVGCYTAQPLGCGGNSDIICTTPGVDAVPASCSTPTSTPSTLQPGGSTSDSCGNTYTCSSTPTTTTLTTTSTVTSSSAIAACTAAAAAAQNAVFSTQNISIQSATSVLNRLNQLRQINQSSGGTAATPETGGAGGATSSLAGGQPTSLSGSGIGGGGGGGQAAGTGGGGERAVTRGGGGTTERRARTTREARTSEGRHSRGAAADGDQRAQLSAASFAGRGGMGGGRR